MKNSPTHFKNRTIQSKDSMHTKIDATLCLAKYMQNNLFFGRISDVDDIFL